MGTYREDHSSTLSREQVSEEMNRVAKNLEHRVQLRQLMTYLKPKERKVVYMRAAGYTYREIAESCNISMRAVSLCLERMRQRLKLLALI